MPNPPNKNKERCIRQLHLLSPVNIFVVCFSYGDPLGCLRIAMHAISMSFAKICGALQAKKGCSEIWQNGEVWRVGVCKMFALSCAVARTACLQKNHSLFTLKGKYPVCQREYYPQGEDSTMVGRRILLWSIRSYYHSHFYIWVSASQNMGLGTIRIWVLS